MILLNISELLQPATSKCTTMKPSRVFTFRPEMASTVTSDRQQIPPTWPFWVMFGSRFIEPISNRMFAALERTIQVLHSLLWKPLYTFAHGPQKCGKNGPTVVYALHKWRISIFSKTPEASNSHIYLQQGSSGRTLHPDRKWCHQLFPVCCKSR